MHMVLLNTYLIIYPSAWKTIDIQNNVYFKLQVIANDKFITTTKFFRVSAIQRDMLNLTIYRWYKLYSYVHSFKMYFP